MNYQVSTNVKKILADTITPVSIYLKLRDIFPNSVLMEGADSQGSRNSYSFIALEPVAEFMVEDAKATLRFPHGSDQFDITREQTVIDLMTRFIRSFETVSVDPAIVVNGLFGYSSYDAIQYFESIKLTSKKKDEEKIPEIRYAFYRYIIAINHFQNTLTIIENVFNGGESQIGYIEGLLQNLTFPAYRFSPQNCETSNLSDQEYMDMVSKGKDHCHRGDVFQIVLSRGFSQQFTGDDFNVYRSLRSINPSPYLYYFDYGSYRIFGSSPEAQLEVKGDKAYIHPIAGTFRRTGNDEKDKELAIALSNDPKENAEHVMLVDLARNDLSRNAENVKVETFREIQYYSHVLHMVSVVSGCLPIGSNPFQVMADSFPAGTLSGAPKFKAMELIDTYENKRRGFYGGCLGYMGFNGDFNHAIMIRSFLSKNNVLYYQAGAGIVADSKEENELHEVNNKLMALKKAIDLAKNI
ncbi:MAG TPA: anthranilate synthase component I family protein [Bacteroidales bacterium]|nr:anthranilate synthase component I family protein [Bacteroidales bacterium]